VKKEMMDSDSDARERAVLAHRLKDARLHAGVTQAEAAEAAGVQRTAVSMWERGKTLPGLLAFRAIVTLYGVGAHRTLFGTSPVSFTVRERQALMKAAGEISPEIQSKLGLLFAMLVEGNLPEARGDDR
jgi:transcriptional regulator with XRE-family HTH domain